MSHRCFNTARYTAERMLVGWPTEIRGKHFVAAAEQYLQCERRRGGFTIFAMVDALTKLSQRVDDTGNQTELDSRIGSLRELAA